MSAAAVPPVDQPPELSPRTVTAVRDDHGGQLVEFDCSHVVWFAIHVKPGDRYYCSVCFGRLFESVRAWQARANLAAVKTGASDLSSSGAKLDMTNSPGAKLDEKRRGNASELETETDAGVSVPGAPALDTPVDACSSHGIEAAAVESGGV